MASEMSLTLSEKEERESKGRLKRASFHSRRFFTMEDMAELTDWRRS